MSSGWISLHRQLSNHPMWLAEPFTRGQAWVDLLMLANHKDGYIRVQGMRIEVLRGQVSSSEVTLAERWRWSRGKVRRFLDELETDKMVVKERYSGQDKRKCILTIVNYDQFQNIGNQDDTSNSTSNGTGDGQATDKRRYSSNKGNKGNKKSKDSCADPSQGEGCAPQEDDPIAFSLPLNVSGEFYPITESKIAELSPLYPAINVREQVGLALGWLIGNPSKRKTRGGVMRFLTSWLAKEQNKGGFLPVPVQAQPRATTVHQLKQAEGDQKALLLRQIRSSENGQGNDAQVAAPCGPAVPGAPVRCGTGGDGGLVAGGLGLVRNY